MTKLLVLCGCAKLSSNPLRLSGMAKNLYRDLLVWQKSVSLIKEVYAEAEKLPKSEEYNLKQQLKRAVVSVSLNTCPVK